jgi:hypothetical protein
MRPQTVTVVAKVKCACERDGKPWWVRIRRKFQGNTGTATEPCWYCRRQVTLEMRGKSNFIGYVESIPGSYHNVPTEVDVEYVK